MSTTTSQKRKRFRDYGFTVGFLPIGVRNAITDVKGVTVGHYTKITGEDIRTGVTIIDPGVSSLFQKKISAAIAVGNGYGKIAGTTQVEELGTLEAPIALTNTLAIGPVLRGMIDIILDREKKISPIDSINVVVGETNDGYLNDLHKDAVTKNDCRAAYESRGATVEEGNVGAGTGTRCFSWKGGIGTSSRKVRIGSVTYTLGVVVQTNFGGSLTILGTPIGELLGKNDFPFTQKNPDGSCMIIVATDTPLSPLALKRIAKRTFIGLTRTGSILSATSGDYAVAFSTSGKESLQLDSTNLNQLFLAAVEATEESVYNALFAATTMRGRGGNILKEAPIDRIVDLLKTSSHGTN